LSDAEGEYNNAEDDDELEFDNLPEADRVIYQQQGGFLVPVNDAEASSLAIAINQLTTNGHGKRMFFDLYALGGAGVAGVIK
jgi:hypothetical protein